MKRRLVHLPWLGMVLALAVMLAVQWLYLMPEHLRTVERTRNESLQALIVRDLGVIRRAIDRGDLSYLHHWVSNTSAMQGVARVLILDHNQVIVAASQIALEGRVLSEALPELSGELEQSGVYRQSGPVDTKLRAGLMRLFVPLFVVSSIREDRGRSVDVLVLDLDSRAVQADIMAASMRSFVIGSAICFLVALPFQMIVYFQVTRRMQNLVDELWKFGEGKVDLDQEDTSGDEIAVVLNSVRMVARQIHERTTQLNEQKQKLADSEKLFRAVFDHAVDGIGMCDEQGQCVLANPAMSKLTGFPHDELKCLRAGEVLPAAMSPETMQRLQLGQRVQQKISFTRRDGQTVQAEVSLDRVVLDGRSLVISVVHDVTLAHAQEARFRAAFENVSIGHVIFSRRGRVELINGAAESIFSRKGWQCFSKHVLRLVAPEFRADLARRFAEGGDQTFRLPVECRGVRPSGETFSMRFTLSAMDLPGGNQSFIASVEDRSAIEHLEYQLMQLQKMEAIGQLTGGIAHDFNNILGIISGNLDILRRLVVEPKQLERLNSAVDTVRRGARLTKKLLDFSRQQPGNPVRVDLREFIENMRDMLDRSLAGSIVIELQLASDLWPVQIDTVDFENALLNLAINARDAMPEGGKFLIEASNISMDAEFAAKNGFRAGRFIALSFSDTGHGIPEEIQARVFDPFYSTKEKGKGTGLGLSMVYGFVRRARGYVKLYSAPGHGTTFRFFLPAGDAGVEHGATPAASELAPPRGTETILVVDDEAGLREIAVYYLEHLGYRTLVAASGAQALEILSATPGIDVLFTDVLMPGMDGYQLARRALQIRPGLKVLITSGYTANKEAAMAHEGVPDALIENLLSKPYTELDLATHIRQTLQRAAAPQPAKN